MQRFFIRVKQYTGGAIEDSSYSDDKRSSVLITPSKFSTSYVIRAYQTISDNKKWSDNYVSESVISVVKDGQDGGGGSTTPGEPGAPGTPGIDSTSYWLTSPVSSIVYNSLGSPTPLFFQVTCKKQSGANPVSNCNSFYLASKKIDADGTKIAVGSSQSSIVTLVVSSKSMTHLSVRAYSSKTDAEAWNNNYALELGVSIVKNGTNGANGAMPRMCGRYEVGIPYVYNSECRDIIFYPFSGVNYIFQVKVYGSSVSVPPTSVDGDSNWESANRFSFVATDTLLADGANLAGLMFKDGIMQSQDETAGMPNLTINGKTGEITAQIGTFAGKINTPYVLLTKSDAVNTSRGVFMLKNNLNIAARLDIADGTIHGCTIVLPTDAKYNGAHANILDFSYPPYTRSSYPTTVRVENGDKIGNTKDNKQSLESQTEQASVDVIGGELRFHAVPDYGLSFQFTKVKWILEH